MKLSEIIAKVIPLAQASREYWETELPKYHPDYPFVNPEDEYSVPPPAEEKKLRKLLKSLPNDVMYQLFLVLDLGRYRVKVGDLATHFRALKARDPDTTILIELFIGQIPLASYLEDALTMLRDASLDVDNLPLKLSKARK